MPVSIVTNAVQVQRYTDAVYGIAVGTTTMNQVNSDITSVFGGSLDKALNFYYTASGLVAATVAANFTKNIGVVAGGTITAQHVTDMTAYVTALLRANPGNEGATLKALCNTFANATSDPVYGTAVVKYNADVDTALAYTGVSDVSAGTVVASPFTLTTGVDTFPGTAGNDTFSGTASDTFAATDTYTTSDTLNGGAGTDTLNITVSGTNNPTTLASPTVSGIEIVNVRAALGTAGTITTVAATNFSGLTAINSDRSTSAITLSGLTAAQQVGMTGNGSITNGALTAGFAATATSGTFNISGGTTAGVLTQTGAGITSNTINSTGAANVLTNVVLSGTANTALTINAATTLTTGNITGFTGTTSTITVAGAAASTSSAGAVNLGTIENTTVRTINASGLTAGGVTATLNTNTGIQFTGGAGNDFITAGAILVAGASVNAGAGTGDRITFTNANQLTATTGPLYTNFEVLQATGATGIDMSLISGITSLRTSGNATFTNVTAAQAAAITTIASGNLDIGVKDAATTGQLDTVSITTSATNTAVAIGTLAAAGVETINLTANTGTGLTSITTLAHAAGGWSQLNLSGASPITVTTTATAAQTNTAINASTATGIVTIDASLSTTLGLAITGGSAADVLTGSAQADVIRGGEGADVITGGDGADILTGGAGADVFTYAASATQLVTYAGANTTAALIEKITDFVVGTDTIRIVTGSTFANIIPVVGTPTGFTVNESSLGVLPSTPIPLAAGLTTITLLTAAMQTAATGVASTVGVTGAATGIQAYTFATAAGAGAFDGKVFLVINDDTAPLAATDVIIELTGITGTFAASSFVLS
jgi:hypothetical protein